MSKKFRISPEKWIKSYQEKELPHWAKSQKPSKLASSFVKILKKRGITKGKIIEIGCGNGRDSFFIAQKGFDVVGIDISPEAIRFCEKNKTVFLKKKIIKKSRVKFLVADAEKLPFKKGSFVGGYSAGVLHGTDLKKTLKELARVTKTEGLLMIHLFEKTILLPSQKVKRNYPAEKVKNILTRLPFRVLKFKSNITKKKPDFDKKAGLHKHFSIIVILERIPVPC